MFTNMNTTKGLANEPKDSEMVDFAKNPKDKLVD